MKSLIYKTHDVQATIAGRKTAHLMEIPTKYVVNDNPSYWDYAKILYGEELYSSKQAFEGKAMYTCFGNIPNDEWLIPFKAPYTVGQIVPIKESYLECIKFDEDDMPEVDEHGETIDMVVYRAENPNFKYFDGTSDFPVENPPWVQARRMPIKHARIWVEITNVTAIRLQGLSPNNAGDMGVEYENADFTSEPGAMHADYKNYLWVDDEKYEDYHFPYYANPIESFKSLYIKMYGRDTWNANPWHWLIEYKVLSTTGKPNNL